MGKIPTFDGLDPAIVNFGTDKVEIWQGTYGSPHGSGPTVRSTTLNFTLVGATRVVSLGRIKPIFGL